MQIFDFKKDPMYKARPEPEIITIPRMLFVMFDGEGAPQNPDGSESAFQRAMQIIFGIIYTIKKARLEYFEEGDVVQMMHIGSYDTEAADIEKMHQFAVESGYELTGRHHELYFSDPRRTSPEKLKTILRQPIRK